MSSALLVDTTSVFSFQQYLKKHDYPVQGNINYGALLESLHRNFPNGGFNPMLAFVAINPEHEGQQKFCAYLRNQQFIVDETDFRDAFVIPDKESPYQRLSTRIAYLAGMLAQKYDQRGGKRTLPHLVVVTDAFDVYYPLLDYIQNRGGAVTVAFFRRGLEDRWQRAGLFDEDSDVQFCDLSVDARVILGVDLGSTLGQRKGGSGLADFEL
ncbi:MAG: hypothetical protein KJ749_10505 [Planctomycetes bacterium]|nr:hypothetical protein [Planctomycetota bacterium]